MNNALLNSFNSQQKHNPALYHKLNRLKELQQLRKTGRLNDIDKYIDNDSLKQSIIAPIKIVKPSQIELAKEYDHEISNHRNNLEAYWRARNNQPYKTIITNDKYRVPLEGAKIEDLIVHRVTDADKLGLLEEFAALKRTIVNQDDSIKIIYDSTHEAEHKQKFEYHNLTKYAKFDVSSFGKLKKDRIKYYQKEQKQLEMDKKKVEDFIESAICNGALTAEELRELEQVVTNDEFDINIDQNAETDDMSDRIIVRTKGKQVSNDSPTTHNSSYEPIKNQSCEVSQDVKNKYKSRQKKLL